MTELLTDVADILEQGLLPNRKEGLADVLVKVGNVLIKIYDELETANALKALELAKKYDVLKPLPTSNQNEALDYIINKPLLRILKEGREQ